MTDMSNYLILSDEKNAKDNLIQALVFLSQIEQNRFHIKWFIIAFHSALYSYMLLVIKSVDNEKIYEVDKKKKIQTKKRHISELDRLSNKKLIDFLTAYKLLHDAEFIKGNAFKNYPRHDRSMKELNNKLRNLFMHFRPMAWASEPWYPARVCLPLIDLLIFCINFEEFKIKSEEKHAIESYVKSIKLLLKKHSL